MQVLILTQFSRNIICFIGCELHNYNLDYNINDNLLLKLLLIKIISELISQSCPFCCELNHLNFTSLKISCFVVVMFTKVFSRIGLICNHRR